jgi:DnaK suppressor protein
MYQLLDSNPFMCYSPLFCPRRFGRLGSAGGTGAGERKEHADPVAKSSAKKPSKVKSPVRPLKSPVKSAPLKKIVKIVKKPVASASRGTSKAKPINRAKPAPKKPKTADKKLKSAVKPAVKKAPTTKQSKSLPNVKGSTKAALAAKSKPVKAVTKAVAAAAAPKKPLAPKPAIQSKKPAKSLVPAKAVKPIPAKPLVAAKPAIARPTAQSKPPIAAKAPAALKVPVKAPLKAPVKAIVKASSKSGRHSLSSESRAEPFQAQPAVATNQKRLKSQIGISVRDLEHYADLLLAKRGEIVGDMSSMEREALRSGSYSNLSTLPVHMADMGTDNFEQEFTLGLVEKDRNLLREINNALAKIQNGTYGICEGTGLPIGKPRLEAAPWARYSIEYARQREKNGMGVRTL